MKPVKHTALQWSINFRCVYLYTTSEAWTTHRIRRERLGRSERATCRQLRPDAPVRRLHSEHARSYEVAPSPEIQSNRYTKPLGPYPRSLRKYIRLRMARSRPHNGQYHQGRPVHLAPASARSCDRFPAAYRRGDHRAISKLADRPLPSGTNITVENNEGVSNREVARD